MKKMNEYLMFLAVILTLMLTVGCNGEDLNAGYGNGVVEVTFIEEGQVSDSSRSLVPDSYGRGNVRLVRNYEPNSLFWLYTAEHKYNVSTGHQSSVYATGETRDASGNLVKTPVSPDGGLGFVGFNTRMSVGDWEIKLYGYDATDQAGCTDAKKLYEATKEVTITGSTTDPVPLQKIGFTLNFTGTGDYAKRYLMVTAFDAKIKDLGKRDASKTTNTIRCSFFWIKNDLSGYYKTGSANVGGNMIATKDSSFDEAIGKTFHFDRMSDGKDRREIGDDYLDYNECLHFFTKLNHYDGTNYSVFDVSDFITVPTKAGFTTYIDGKIFQFGALKRGGGTVFFIDNSAGNCCYRFFKSAFGEVDPDTISTAITIGTDLSDYYYIYTDYPQSSGSGAGTTAPHKDKYYVWNESLVAGDMSYFGSGSTMRSDSSVTGLTDAGTEWIDYTIGGVTYKFDGRESNTSSTMGTGRSRTEYWINIYRRGVTGSSSSYTKYYKVFWEAPGCIAPYVRNLRASKAKGCDDWYIPSQGELKMLLSDSTRRTAIAKHCCDIHWGSGSKVIISSSVCASASGSSAARFNAYTSVDSTSYTYSSSGMDFWCNVGVTPIRSF